MSIWCVLWQTLVTALGKSGQMHAIHARATARFGPVWWSVRAEHQLDLRQAARHFFVGAGGVEAYAEQRIGLGNAGEELLHRVARTFS